MNCSSEKDVEDIMYTELKKIFEEKKLRVPLTVPEEFHEEYRKNYLNATASSGRLFLFAGDQKIEHLNEDFYGAGIHEQSAIPKHLFEIASQARIGAFATQLGLIARYADDHRDVNYIVKMNSKTNLVPTSIKDPYSGLLSTIDQVVQFKNRTGLSIVGIGYTLYLGSKHEACMLEQVSKLIYEAHQHGLIVVLWMYPRGEAVTDETHENIIAGAAGVGVSLGADFVKVNQPKAKNGFDVAEKLKQATYAAGRTGIICSGGSRKDKEQFLDDLYHQIHTGRTRGAAIGRNIHQRPLDEAVKFCAAIATIIMDDKDVECAKKLL